MAKHLRHHKSSTMANENTKPGCLWGVLHFFDFLKHLHNQKMLRDRRHGDGTRAAGGIKILSAKPNVTVTAKEHDSMHIEPNFLVEDRINSTNKVSGKASIRTLIAEEMSRGQKQRIPFFPPRLMRTISIHHLECNDFVCPDEMTSESETPRAELDRHDTDSSAVNGHIPVVPKAPDEAINGTHCEVCGNMNITGHDQPNELGNLLVEKQVLQEKLYEAKSVSLEQKSVDDKELRRDVALHQSKNVLDPLELFNSNKEIFLKVLQEPNSVFRNSFQCQQDSSTMVALSKSSSFPAASFSGRTAGLFKLQHKTKEIETFSKQEGKSQTGKSPSVPNTVDSSKDAGAPAVTSMVDDVAGGSKPDPKSETAGTGGNYEFSVESKDQLKNQRDGGTVRNHFKSIKQRVKDVIRDGTKEKDRISMDRILHKIPYGSKGSQDIRGKHPGHWEGRDRSKSCCESDMIFSSNNKHAHPDIRRSRSLTESLDGYSQFFEFTLSLNKEPKRYTSERLRLSHEVGGLPARDSSKSLGRIFSLREFESHFSGKDDQIPISFDSFCSRTSSMDRVESNIAICFGDSGEQKPVGSLVNTQDYSELDTVIENAGLEHAMENNASITIDGGSEQRSLDNVNNGTVMYDVLADVTTENTKCTSHKQEIRTEVDDSNNSGNPSPISVLDSYFQDDLINPAQLSASEGSESRPRQIHFEMDSLTNPEDQSAADVTNVVETVTADFGELQILCKQTNCDSSYVQVDWEDEPEFSYVKNILKKSGFSSDEFLGTWYSPDQPVDPSLFDEVESSLLEDISRDESNIYLDHLLLFDLINEVLLEIYERSSDFCPWISCFESQIRPIPMGHHVLEEVWENIGWYLSSQPQLNPTLECVVGRGHSKNDGWMNLRLDTESVGLELESLIFQDLLNEALLHFLDSGHPCALS